MRLQEVLKGITHLFKRLQICWNKANENTAAMDYTNVEALIPFKDPTLATTLHGGRDLRADLEKKRG